MHEVAAPLFLINRHGLALTWFITFASDTWGWNMWVRRRVEREHPEVGPGSGVRECRLREVLAVSPVG
jgi:hypothetical protein